MPELFDGASFLVRGELRDLIREQLGPAQPEAEVEVAVGGEQERQMQRDEGEGPTPPPARPLPVKRYMRVRLTVPAMPVVKIPNLQPYLWKVLQEADAGSTLQSPSTSSAPRAYRKTCWRSASSRASTNWASP